MGSTASTGEESQTSSFSSETFSCMELFSQPVSQVQTSVENKTKQRHISSSAITLENDWSRSIGESNHHTPVI